jgi:hypothetical protein
MNGDIPDGFGKEGVEAFFEPNLFIDRLLRIFNNVDKDDTADEGSIRSQFQILGSVGVCRHGQSSWLKGDSSFEEWFASVESNVFRLSRYDVNGVSFIMITSGRPLSGKDF